MALNSVSPMITVKNVKRSLAWYQEVLGFTPEQQMRKRADEKNPRGEGPHLVVWTSPDTTRLAEGIEAAGGRVIRTVGWPDAGSMLIPPEPSSSIVTGAVRPIRRADVTTTLTTG